VPVYHFIRVSPFDHDCVDEAVKTLTLAVQANQTLAVDRPQLTTTYHTGHFPPLADTVQVTAAGGAAVAITVQSVTDTGGPWLRVTAQRPTTPAALSISYSVSGLAQGTYCGRVTVTTGGLVAQPPRSRSWWSRIPTSSPNPPRRR